VCWKREVLDREGKGERESGVVHSEGMQLPVGRGEKCKVATGWCSRIKILYNIIVPARVETPGCCSRSNTKILISCLLV
jgi:hypothetical protein